jgi:hypothetical protein
VRFETSFNTSEDKSSVDFLDVVWPGTEGRIDDRSRFIEVRLKLWIGAAFRVKT